MALKHKIDTLDGLDEALKPLYAKGEDGRFTLQVDDAPATNTIAKLKADLETATRALKDREVNETKAQAAAEQAKLEAKGDYEKLKQNLEGEKANLLKQVDEAQHGLKSYLLKSELTSAIATHKGNPLLEKLIADQFEAVISPDGAHKVLVKGDPTKTPAQYIEALKANAEYGAFFEGSGVSGGGAQAPGKASGNAFEKMSKTELTLALNNPATKAAATAFLSK
jgi:hypothetical protein